MSESRISALSVETDPFLIARDWHFVVLNPGDVTTLVRCAYPFGAGLYVASSVDSDIKRFVQGENVIVVAPEYGPGVEAAKELSNQLRGLAKKLVLWTCPDLGSENTPDLVTFEEFYGQGEDGSLAKTLLLLAPWKKPPFSPHANGNGKNAKDVSIETAEREDVGDPIGTVDPAAFHGVLGEIVNKLLPVTEANGLFMLAHLLAMCGASMGRTPHFGRGLDVHMNPQFALIGPTAKGRKRTARVASEKAFRVADPEFADHNIFDGLASGRGLMEHLRDANTRIGEKGKEVHDPGVTDKRRLFIEEEIASVLKHGNRDNETLLPLIRQFADSKYKIHMATKAPITVTEAHLVIVGHGTASETRSLLMDREKSGGTANRFIWLWGVRHKAMPGGADLDGAIKFFDYDLKRLGKALDRARETSSVVFAPKIFQRWEKEYRKLEDVPSGPIADMYARGPSIVIRLASIFTLLDKEFEIGDVHLDAALAIWAHSERTLKYMFAADLDKDTEKIKAALRGAPEGLTRTQITNDVFQKRPPAGLDDALRDLLVERTILAKKVQPDRGRPSTVFLWNYW